MSDYLIVGAGIMGLLTARELSRAGTSVTLLERGRIGQESSWAGGGILSPLYPWRYPAAVNTLAAWSQVHYHELVEELHQATGVDAEWVRSGLLILDSDETTAATAWAEGAGATLERIAANTLERLEPALAACPADGLLLPAVAQVRNPYLVHALRLDLTARGVRIAEHAEVTRLLTRQGHICGVGTEAGEIAADRVVITAGAWSARLLKTLGECIDVAPVRGQMLLYHGAPGLLRHIILHAGRYLIPRRDGRILVGSTMEEVGFDKSTTIEARKELEAAAQALVPILAQTPLERHWAGLRPGSPDGVPYIGAHPTVAGLFLNTGHFRNGLVMAPASARLLVDLILGRPPIIAPQPYALDGHHGVA